MENFMCLTSDVLQDLINATRRIEINSDIPTPDGKTVRWDTPRRAVGQTFWYIFMPFELGWNRYSRINMMRNVSGVSPVPFDESWRPHKDVLNLTENK